jgi:hypothetical protein
MINRTRYRLSGHIKRIDAPDATVLLDVRAGTCHIVNRTGSRVLTDLLNGARPEDVIEHLSTELHSPRVSVERDVNSFVETLLSQQFIDVSSDTGESSPALSPTLTRG